MCKRYTDILDCARLKVNDSMNSWEWTWDLCTFQTEGRKLLLLDCSVNTSFQMEGGRSVNAEGKIQQIFLSWDRFLCKLCMETVQFSFGLCEIEGMWWYIELRSMASVCAVSLKSCGEKQVFLPRHILLCKSYMYTLGTARMKVTDGTYC